MSYCSSESTVEDAALTWLESLGWHVAHGPDMGPVHLKRTLVCV